MENTNGMSPADFAAMMGNGNGCCNGNNMFIWIIVLFLLVGGGGLWGRNNGDFGQYATAASQNQILFGQQFQAIDNKIDRLGNGIADATFALNNTIHAAQDVIAGAVTNEGRGIQMQIANEARGFQQIINEGFCGTNRNIDANRYEAQKNTRDIIDAIHADGEATRGLFVQQENQRLRDRVASLEMDNRMCGVVRYPMTYAYSAGQSPFCNCGNNCC